MNRNDKCRDYPVRRSGPDLAKKIKAHAASKDQERPDEARTGQPAFSYLEFHRDLAGGMLHSLRYSLVLLKLTPANSLEEPKRRAQQTQEQQKQKRKQVSHISEKTAGCGSNRPHRSVWGGCDSMDAPAHSRSDAGHVASASHRIRLTRRWLQTRLVFRRRRRRSLRRRSQSAQFGTPLERSRFSKRRGAPMHPIARDDLQWFRSASHPREADRPP